MKVTEEGLHFFIHTPNLLREQIMHGMREQDRAALFIPLRVFGNYLALIADRCAQINDPILNELMVDMTLYSVADPELPEYDLKAVRKVRKIAADYRKQQKMEIVR